MRKTLLIGALAAAGLAGCATGPYDSYGAGYGYGPGYDPYYYNNAPGYYYGPDVGVGYYYYDNSGQRHWHDGDRGHNDGHWRGDGSWQGHGDSGQPNNAGSLPDLPGGGDWRGTPTPPGGDRSRFQQ